MTVMQLELGEWRVTFDPQTGEWTAGWYGGAARIDAVLSFHAGGQSWTFAAPRDGVPDRPALVDPHGNVQGYLSFTADGGQLELLVLHRTAQNFEGLLRLEGQVRLDGRPFACRTRPPEQPDVVQMASGAADSRLNDALFDPENDRILQFSAASISLAARQAGFALAMRAAPHRSGADRLVFKAVDDFFRRRYAPYYKPIDRGRCSSPPSGWMSWNVYFDQAGSAENLAEARLGAEYLKPFGLEFWSIESWQANSDRLPVRHFHNLCGRPHPGQFPEGMAWLASEIRRLGFRPGIWVVLFGTGNEDFYREHRAWFLHASDGRPMSNWSGDYLLDPSQQEVRDFMRDRLRRMKEDWGYEFFKIDGMSGRSEQLAAHFFERDEVRSAFREICSDPMARCVEAFRDGIGPDSVFLACQGHYTGPEAGQADAARIGGDMVSPNQPSRWHNVLDQARRTLNQLFVHQVVFYNDPDTLLVGTSRPLEEARVTASIVALPGQVTFAGDRLAGLEPDRMRLLQQALPVCRVQPLDLYPVFTMAPVWDLKVCRRFGQWDVVSLFNWEDDDREIELEFDRLGLDPGVEHLVYEAWTDTFLGSHTGGLAIPVPGRATRQVTLRPERDRPQFICTDRHITRGAVSLRDERWDPDRGVLSLCIELVAGFPFRYVVHIPSWLMPIRVTAASGVKASIEMQSACAILHVRAPESGAHTLRLVTATRDHP